MDVIQLAGIAAGIPTLSIILLAAKIGRWQGTMEKGLEGHDKWIKEHSREKSASDKRLEDAVKEQRQICKDQKESCAKVLSYMTSRVNGIKDHPQ